MADEIDLQELVDRLKKAIPCAVCRSWILRGNPLRRRRTCSEECARVWRNTSARFALNDEEHEKHRLSIARNILKKPEKRTQAEIRWAKEMLGDNPPPPTRRFAVEGSETIDVLNRVAPHKLQPVKPRKPSWTELRQNNPLRFERMRDRHKAYKKAMTLLGQRHERERFELSQKFRGEGVSASTAWQRALQELKNRYPDEFNELFQGQRESLSDTG